MKRIIFLSIIFAFSAFAETQVQSQNQAPRTVIYRYQDREHTLAERAADLSILFGASLGLYYITQKETVERKGSFENYKDNFGKLVFDKDNPFWNVMVHPFSGSQVYLYHRARGYGNMDSLLMTAMESALFEFFVEIYTEPASYQDLYVTPVYGSLIGYGVELISLPMLNSGNPVLKLNGHILNPASMLWFFEGKVYTTPIVSKEARGFTTHFTF